MSLVLAALAAAAPIVCPISRIYECTNEQVESHMRATPDMVAQKNSACLYRTDATCDVAASGTLNGGKDGPRVEWQKVMLSGPFQATEMVMLFDMDEEAVTFIGQAQSDGYFASPELYFNQESGWLLHVPGTRAGTGRGNADLLFAYDERGNWRPIDIESWKDGVEDKLPPGFGIWKGVAYDFGEMFAFSPVWRDSDGNCCATGGNAYLDFAIEGDTLVLKDLTFEETLPAEKARAGAALDLKRLQCPVEQAVYENPEQSEWQVTFSKPRIAPGNASDLLMSVSGIDFARDFAFTQAQGFGGIYLLLTEEDEDAGQPMAVAEQDEDLPFYGFALGSGGGLAPLDTAPQAGDPAPSALFIPAVSKHFWYDAKAIDPETGEALPDRVEMDKGLFVGHCTQQ